jgi:hypothetical protein
MREKNAADQHHSYQRLAMTNIRFYSLEAYLLCLELHHPKAINPNDTTSKTPFAKVFPLNINVPARAESHKSTAAGIKYFIAAIIARQKVLTLLAQHSLPSDAIQYNQSSTAYNHMTYAVGERMRFSLELRTY